MELTYEIFTRKVSEAMKKITGTEVRLFKDMKVYLSLIKLKHDYDRKRQIFDDAETNLVAEYCDKNEKGEPILNPRPGNPDGGFSFHQNRTEFRDRHKELMAQPVSLEMDESIKIKLSVEKRLIEEGHLTPDDFSALIGMIELVE